jgi:glycosyltransferase involved in cell wall biosynthesis
LLVRSDLFNELNCFDGRYSPAYYEESDFCLSLRRKGYKVFYQPSANIIHYEFGTTSFNKAIELQKSNKVKLTKKWGDVLKEHCTNQPENILFARDKDKRPRILVIDDRIPALYLGSGYPRMYKMLHFLLELGYSVTFFPLQNAEFVEPFTRHLQQLGIEVFYNDGTSKLDFQDFLNKRSNYYDAVMVSRPHNAKETIALVKESCPEIPIIYDAEALFSQREISRRRLKGLDMSREEEQQMLTEEISLMRYADVVITVSKKEQETIMQNGINNIMVWGHPMTTNATKSSFSEREGLLFVGSFLEPLSPNEDAMLYFTNDIFSLVQQRLKTRLFIVGMNYLDSVERLASSSIVVTGQVDDLKEYYNKCRVFIIPTKYAAGIPWKLHETMSYGVPSVVTPLIADQLGLTHGKEVLVGRSPIEFADNIISLYEDEKLWNSLRNEGFRYLAEVCDPEKLKHDLSDIFKVVGLNERKNQC